MKNERVMPWKLPYLFYFHKAKKIGIVSTTTFVFFPKNSNASLISGEIRFLKGITPFLDQKFKKSLLYVRGLNLILKSSKDLWSNLSAIFFGVSYMIYLCIANGLVPKSTFPNIHLQTDNQI